MSSPLDQGELDALMNAIKDGRVAPSGAGGEPAPVVPYDLTSQDRIIRGQMPTLDSINDRIASLFGRSLSGRTRIDVRASAGAATVLKFADVQPLLVAPATVGVLTLGSGHGPAVLVLEGTLGTSLLAAALGDRKARPTAAATPEGRVELTAVERMVLRNLLATFAEAMHIAWADVLNFRPEVLRFEADPRMAMVAPTTDVAILCPFDLSGPITGRLLLVIPYAAVEPVKKVLSAPPRLGNASDGDARFSAALAAEIENAEVAMCVEIGRHKLNLSDLIALEVGAVLPLDRAENAPLPIYVEGRLKMMGMPRVVAGSLAVIVEQALAPAAGYPFARETAAASPLLAALEATVASHDPGPSRAKAA